MSEHAQHPYIPTLSRQLGERKIDRREFLRTATLLGMSAAAAYSMLGEDAGGGLMPVAAASLPMGGQLKLGMRVMDVSSPHNFNWIADSNVGRQVVEYLSLTGHDNVTRPYLLESWTPSEDLKIWTLHVRRGIKWHNGRDFTADDVVWNINRVLDPSVRSSVVGFMKGYMLDEFEQDGELTTRLWDASAIERVDAYTVRLNCKEAALAVPEHLFHYPFLMIDPEEGGAFGVGSNGTGAFELVFHEVGKRSVLKARRDYWGEGPYLDQLEFVDLGDDPTGEIDSLAKRELHGIDLVDIIQLEAFALMDHLQMYEVPTASTAVARGKVTRAPFSDPRVRKALRLAVDTRAVQQLIHGVRGLPAEHHHVAPVHPEYASLPLTTRDVEQARRLLVEAGYPDGLDLGTIDCLSDPSWQYNAIQAMTEQWKDAGITVKVNLMASADYWEVWDKTTFGFTGWTHRPLGIMALALAYRSGVPWNESEYANPEFDRLLTLAEGLLDIDARREVMIEIEQLMQEDGPIIQPLWRSELTFMDKRVKGFQMHPSGYVFGNQLALEPS